MPKQSTQEQIVEMDINLLRTFKDHPFKVTADYPMIQLKFFREYQETGIIQEYIGYFC